MVLKKTAALYDRDEDGKLIPQEHNLVIDEDDTDQKELEGETIKLIPMTRGEFKKLLGRMGDKGIENTDMDGELVIKYCIDPSFTQEEVEHLKPAHASAIVNTIFSVSGFDMKRKAKKPKDEDEFAKNSVESS